MRPERIIREELHDSIAQILFCTLPALPEDDLRFLMRLLMFVADNAMDELIGMVTVNRQRLIHEFVRDQIASPH